MNEPKLITFKFITDELEDLESNNNDLRQWGQHWKDECEKKDEEIGDLLSQIDKLNDKITELESQLGQSELIEALQLLKKGLDEV